MEGELHGLVVTKSHNPEPILWMMRGGKKWGVQVWLRQGVHNVGQPQGQGEVGDGGKCRNKVEADSQTELGGGTNLQCLDLMATLHLSITSPYIIKGTRKHTQLLPNETRTSSLTAKEYTLITMYSLMTSRDCSL